MIAVQTNKPVALDSPDHLFPFGTMRDNSTHVQFNQRLYQIIPVGGIRLLDLGCAGGGFVKSVLDDGGLAIGIEGSDYSKVRNRAEWATIPNNLFTADLIEPLRIADDDKHIVFNVITAWEFLEHISEDGLYGLFDNLADHSAAGTLFLGSISVLTDIECGHALHQTVKPRDWWFRRLESEGWKRRMDLEVHFADEWVRGPKSAQPVPDSFFFAAERDQ